MDSFQLDPRLRSENERATALPNTPNPAIAPAPASQHQHHQIPYPPIPGGSPQNLYSPSPQSVNATDHEAHNAQQDGGTSNPTRSRACEACRGLKVRCDTDPNNPEGPCKRCAKANRTCVITAPSRKRQKKADSRIAELEKKIDTLTAALKTGHQPGVPQHGGPQHGGLQYGGGIGEQFSAAQNNHTNPYQQVTNGGFVSPHVARPDAARMQSNKWIGYSKAPEFAKPSAPPMVMAGQKRKHLDSRDSISDTWSTHSRQSIDVGPGQQVGFLSATPQKQQTTSEYADVVDRGIVTTEMATKMFDCYVERMAPLLPAVVFASGTPAAEVRKNKPTLFLAILAAACGMNYPKLQNSLTKEVMAIYAERIICKGEKTLEFIQALHVSTLWYWPPEHFEELKFYQLIHIAAVMAIDIGMSRKLKPSKNKPLAGIWRDHPWRRTPYPDTESIESRRAWLACYFLCCNASMGLRRPNLIRWSPFMDDCVKVLETSLDAAPSDKVLCQWVRSQHIAEEIGTQFSMDDPVASVSIADDRVQLSLKGFERDLNDWTAQIPADIDSPTLNMTKHVVNLYMHEVAMHVDHNVEDFKPPFSEDSLQGMQQTDPLTDAHVDALSICLQSIDGIFDTFLKIDVETIRCLPVAHFVRIAYAVVVLIKMYFAAAKPNSDFGKVINKNKMKVEHYLDGLVEVFSAAAAEEKSRPASKFLMVLMMLKTWFHRQRTRQSEQAEGSENAPIATVETPVLTPDNPTAYADNQQKNQQGYATNTPLHVLSEAATNNQGGSSSSRPATPAGWNQQQYPYDPAMMTQNMPGFGNGNMAMGNIDLSLGMDFGNTMGDGFEQAMGMTLGVGDFGGNYFGDDSFFNSLLDSVGGGPGFEGF